MLTRKQAFSGDHAILQCSLTPGSAFSKLSGLPEQYSGAYRCIFNELNCAMLHIKGSDRPSTKNILELLSGRCPANDTLGRDGHIIRVPNCGHVRRRTGDYKRLTSSIILFFKSELWKDVRWRPHWYGSSLKVLLNETKRKPPSLLEPRPYQFKCLRPFGNLPRGASR